MPSMNTVAVALRSVLTEIADQAGRDTHCIQRHRAFTGASLVQTLVLGWLNHPQATVEQLTQMAATVGTVITPQGLDKRWTEATAACLKQVLEAAVAQVVTSDPVMIPLLNRFTGVWLQDSSVILLPVELTSLWQGCGGTAPVKGKAALKIQVRLDMTTGHLQGPLLPAGRVHDMRAPAQTRVLAAGALRIADLGYFSLPQFQEIQEQEGYWLTRWQAGTVVSTMQGKRLDFIAWLDQQGSTIIDCAVKLGIARQMVARLMAVRVPPEVANERRRHLKAEAKRRGQTVSKKRLGAADWTVYLTNIPAEMVTVTEALVLGRMRWQIELLFKLWKSHGYIDESRSAKPWRILCEIYAKLIGVVMQQWILLTSCWHNPDRSLVKAAQTVRSYVMLLANALRGLVDLVSVLEQIAHCLGVGCRMNSRRKHPNTYQLLLDYP